MNILIQLLSIVFVHQQILYRENYTQTILSGSVNIFEMTEKTNEQQNE